ncbi:1-acyl-sn-glycerol-3-phosphate acyltransferase [Mesosutterella sp. OilRF-GAM-744-9]|uniref:1-acyl-sn-glycerol-3-phosphate acyltransferase n=2 Tax=Mesosutterella TaxID=2494213 RepID=A0ABS9MNX8_9BURK|nr:MULTISPECIES: lysophospholipid acyltransferase family protein [unclassified Mesosutterella]MCG5030326.1 1-acyl-sn-glycerol-3-phosphate acyltransferase [Mesosutterella sp. oilRF-744-WT-GAM-9]MCI6530604.1 1-acyl-sn-glycerol-3-phosphate acyltransferase [Mesosutterella sp.]MDL2059032.1 lysophospholipid acyltransferase family protein [Mesosutterella sp. AGMB02718]
MFDSIRLVTGITLLTKLLVGAYPQWQGCAPSRAQRIYFANHSSHMDAIVVWSSLPPELRQKTRPVAAKDYWEKGALRRRIAIKELRVVLIDRLHSGHTNPLDPLKEALRQGDSLIIFPEGTRRPQPLPSPFKSGLWRLMREFPQVELIPVYIENLHRSMPKGTLIPTPTICSVRFGAPLPHSVEDGKEEFLNRARDAVIKLASS